VLQSDTEEVILDFPELNYSYVNKLPVEDIASFGQEEYGRFFYEYGRALFANLIVAITRLDWYAAGTGYGEDLNFVSEYYHEMLSLNNKVLQVLDAFCDTITLDREYPIFDLIRPSLEILHEKESISLSADTPDIRNTKIMALIYSALWFSITGYLLLFCERSDIDGISRFLASKTSETEAKTLIRSIADSSEDDEKKINICSLLFIFFHINRFYLISSGLTIQDPLLDIVGKISYSLVSLIKDEDDFIIIDSDLINGNSELGPSIAAFTEKYDILDDIIPFFEHAILRNDVANIFEFGREYIYMYKPLPTSDSEYKPIESFLEPCITKYIKKNTNIASYLHSDNIGIQKAFLYITNIINGIEKERNGVVCPGTILQLTLIASTFRLIEKSSNFSSASEDKRLLVEAGIDIIDVLIAVLYKFWFLSGKYFIQPSRPKYTRGSITDTMEELREEVLVIIEEYLEFVHYKDKSSDIKYLDIQHKRLNKMDYITSGDIVNDFFKIENISSYISESAKHGIYSFVYSAIAEGVNDKFTIESLAEAARYTTINSEILRKFYRYTEGVSKAYTRIPIIDALMSAYTAIKQHSYDKPDVVVITIYALLYDTISELIIKYSNGNYFDFTQATNLTKSYRLESIVSEFIHKPLKENTL
jgi:hypothetical protein